MNPDHNEKSKTRKKHLKVPEVGDKIITKSGLHGKVSELADTTVVIETMSRKTKNGTFCNFDGNRCCD
jgi:preprotein translocase subunit YajC